MRMIESLTAPFTLDQPLSTQFQLLHTPLRTNIETRNLKFHLFHLKHVYALIHTQLWSMIIE